MSANAVDDDVANDCSGTNTGDNVEVISSDNAVNAIDEARKICDDNDRVHKLRQRLASLMSANAVDDDMANDCSGTNTGDNVEVISSVV